MDEIIRDEIKKNIPIIDVTVIHLFSNWRSSLLLRMKDKNSLCKKSKKNLMPKINNKKAKWLQSSKPPKKRKKRQKKQKERRKKRKSRESSWFLSANLK